jgi:hypothetical protein
VILHRKSWKTARRAGTLLAATLAATLVAASAVSGLVPAAAAPATGPAVPALPGRPAAAAHSTRLSGVFCTSAANCWSVGDIEVKGAELNLIRHWTGKKWFRATVPSPGGTAPGEISELAAVRCTAARDCWAVGDSEGSRRVDRNQALHWNGRNWLVVRTPSPGAAFSALADVACTSASSCWAVGGDGPVLPALAGTRSVEPLGVRFFELNEILHWNGRKWALVVAPNPGGTGGNALSALASVRCASATDCWAAGLDGAISDKVVGRNQMLHWNGTKWAQVTVPNPAGTKPPQFNGILGLSCTSSASCWAVGSDGSAGSGSTSRFANEVLHWNGRKWFKVSVVNPDGTGPGASNALAGINCSSPTDCWAVGNSGGGSAEPEINQALHWNGTHWSKAAAPNPGGTATGDTSALVSVRCTNAVNCWAVGFERTGSGTDFGQTLHWNGTKWQIG